MLLNFNALTVDPAQGSATLFPLGDYLCEIVKVEPTPVKDAPEKGMLVLTLKVLEGEYKGSTQEYRLNLFNPSEQTVSIAYKQLGAVCLVTGKGGLTDSSELVGGRLLATIGPQDKNDKYSDVKKVMDVLGGSPVKGKPFVMPEGAVPAAIGLASAPVATAPPASAAWAAPTTPAPVTTPVVAPAAAASSATPAWAAPAAADDKPSWMK